MRWFLFRWSPKRMIARQIVREGWQLFGRSGLPAGLNDKLETLLKTALPNNEKDYRKMVLKAGGIIKEGLGVYQADFLCIENIKHNIEVLEKERINRLHDFENLVTWLMQERKLDEFTARRTLKEVQALKSKLRSEISIARGREARLKGSV